MDDAYEATTNQFLQWLQHKNITVSPKMALVDMRPEGRGRGAIATQDIEEDEVIFSIPRDAVLNVRNSLSALSSAVNGGLTTQDIDNMPPWLSLTLLLMIESSNPDSPWRPYLSILPPHLDSLVFWTPDQLAHLQASAVTHKLGREEADRLYTTHIAPLNIPGGHALFHHIASLIMAYAFDIPEHQIDEKEEDEEEELQEDNEQTILTMIPLADMLNADADHNNARLMCDAPNLEMRALKPILKGQEIFNDYGQLPRADLLRRYGYVTENYAKYDVCEVSLALILETIKNQPLNTGVNFDIRVQVAEREGVLEEAYDLTHADEQEDQYCIPDELVALLYILSLDNESFTALQRSIASLPSSRIKMATHHVGQICGTILHNRVAQYETNLEEDRDLLRDGPDAQQLDHRTRMAIQVRLGEKEVLLEALAEAATFLSDNKKMRCAQPYKLQSGKRARDNGNAGAQNKKHKS